MLNFKQTELEDNITLPVTLNRLNHMKKEETETSDVITNVKGAQSARG